MPIKLTLGEVIDVLVKREKVNLKMVALDMGYKPNTFYSKRLHNRWNIRDLKALKARFDLNIDEVLDQL